MLQERVVRAIQEGYVGVELPFAEEALIRAVRSAWNEGYVTGFVGRYIVTIGLGTSVWWSVRLPSGHVMKLVDGITLRPETHDSGVQAWTYLDATDTANPLYAGLALDADLKIRAEFIPFIQDKILFGVFNATLFPSVDVTTDIAVLDIDKQFYDRFFGPIFNFDFNALQGFVQNFSRR